MYDAFVVSASVGPDGTRAGSHVSHRGSRVGSVDDIPRGAGAARSYVSYPRYEMWCQRRDTYIKWMNSIR